MLPVSLPGRYPASNPVPPGVHAGAVPDDIAAHDINLGVKLAHLVELELGTPVLAQPVVGIVPASAVGAGAVPAGARVEQALAPRAAYAAELLLEVRPDEPGGQGGEQVGLVGGDEQGDGVGGLAGAGAAHAALQGQQHVVQVRGGVGEDVGLGDGGGVDDEDDGLEPRRLRALGGQPPARVVAQLAVAGCVDQQELARVGARGVEVVAEGRGAAVLADGELDGGPGLRGVGLGGGGAALEQGVQRRLSGARGPGEEDGGEHGVGRRLGDPEVHEDGHDEHDEPADDEDGRRGRHDELDEVLEGVHVGRLGVGRRKLCRSLVAVGETCPSS